MKQFEYKVEWITSGSYELEKRLKNLGAEGWELVGIKSDYFIFKRENIKKDGI